MMDYEEIGRQDKNRTDKDKSTIMYLSNRKQVRQPVWIMNDKVLLVVALIVIYSIIQSALHLLFYPSVAMKRVSMF
jgi:hypothetical protein